MTLSNRILQSAVDLENIAAMLTNQLSRSNNQFRDLVKSNKVCYIVFIIFNVIIVVLKEPRQNDIDDYTQVLLKLSFLLFSPTEFLLEMTSLGFVPNLIHNLIETNNFAKWSKQRSCLMGNYYNYDLILLQLN